jgi:hypothetical protein
MATMEILHVTANGVRSAGVVDLSRKHGCYYGVRPLPDNGGWRIHVTTYRKGVWVSTDMNSTPWAFRNIAIERAKSSAEIEAAQYSPALPVIQEG